MTRTRPFRTDEDAVDAATDPQLYEVFEVLRVLELVREHNPRPNPFPEPEQTETWTVLSNNSEQVGLGG